MKNRTKFANSFRAATQTAMSKLKKKGIITQFTFERIPPREQDGRVQVKIETPTTNSTVVLRPEWEKDRVVVDVHTSGKNVARAELPFSEVDAEGIIRILSFESTQQRKDA